MIRAYLGTFLSLAGLTCGLTWLYLGMRSVMEIGGACAEGGPYVVAQPCPDGVPMLMIGGIFGGLICLGLFMWCASKLGTGYVALAAFAWPALFLSLGWNFLEFGVDPPPPEEGLVWGWLVCAPIFFLMGGLPLIALLRPSALRSMLWPKGEERDPTGRGVPMASMLGSALPRRRSRESRDEGTTRPGSPGYPEPRVTSRIISSSDTSPTPTATAPAAPPGDHDVVGQLERLAALRDRGAIDAAEYERAKRAVLDE